MKKVYIDVPRCPLQLHYIHKVNVKAILLTRKSFAEGACLLVTPGKGQHQLGIWALGRELQLSHATSRVKLDRDTLSPVM